MASSSNVHLLETDRFNAVDGIDVNDYVANIEAEVRANKTPQDLVGEQCVKLARTRLDTTKSIFLKHVTQCIDTRPVDMRTWEWVKQMLITTFGNDITDPFMIHSLLVTLKPLEYTIRGINACMAQIQTYLYKWDTTDTPTPVTPFDRAANIDNQIRFYTISIMSTLFPEAKRLTIIQKLKSTPTKSLPGKIVDLLNTHNITMDSSTHTTMAIQSSNTPQQQYQQHHHQNHYQQQPPQQYTDPKGIKSYQGTHQDRGSHNPKYNTPYQARQTQYQHNQGQYRGNSNTTAQKQQQALGLWPSPNQCLNCYGFGHRMRSCQRNAYCPLHDNYGHTLLQCNSFHQLTGINFNVRGNSFLECGHGGGTIPLTHPDLEYWIHTE